MNAAIGKSRFRTCLGVLSLAVALDMHVAFAQNFEQTQPKEILRMPCKSRSFHAVLDDRLAKGILGNLKFVVLDEKYYVPLTATAPDPFAGQTLAVLIRGYRIGTTGPIVVCQKGDFLTASQFSSVATEGEILEEIRGVVFLDRAPIDVFSTARALQK